MAKWKGVEMDFGRIPLFSGLVARLDYLASRTTVIAQNIANADTPNYQAKDVKAPNFGRMAQEAAAMRVTDPRHLSSTSLSPTSLSSARSSSHTIVAAPDAEASLTGNQVSIETQAMKLSETRQEYALAANIYRKGLAMLRLAARGQ